MSNYNFSICLLAITIGLAVAAVSIPTAPVVRQSRPILQPPPQVARVKPQTNQGAVRPPNNQFKSQQPQPQPQIPQMKPPTPQSDDDESESPEEILNVYFDFIKNNDENNCLMRLICQIGYNRTAFGNFGEQISSFFTEIESNTGAAAQYRTAFQTHLTEPNVAKCIEKYPNCQYETNDMIEVGNDLMNRNLTNIQLDDVKKGPAWIAQPN